MCLRYPISSTCARKPPRTLGGLISERVASAPSRGKTVHEHHNQAVLVQELPLEGRRVQGTAEEVVKKLGCEHVEVRATSTQKSLQQLKELAQTLEEAQQQAKWWSKDNCQQHFDQAVHSLQEADAVVVQLKADTQTLKQARLLEVRTLSGDRRRLALNVHHCAKPLADQ